MGHLDYGVGDKILLARISSVNAVRTFERYSHAPQRVHRSVRVRLKVARFSVGVFSYNIDWTLPAKLTGPNFCGIM